MFIPETTILSSTVNLCATSVVTLAMSPDAVSSESVSGLSARSPTILNSALFGSKSFLSG